MFPSRTGVTTSPRLDVTLTDSPSFRPSFLAST